MEVKEWSEDKWWKRTKEGEKGSEEGERGSRERSLWVGGNGNRDDGGGEKRGEKRTVRRRQRFVWPSVVCDIWGGRQRLLTFLFFPFSVHGLFGFFFSQWFLQTRSVLLHILFFLISNPKWKWEIRNDPDSAVSRVRFETFYRPN